jgi:hypothetical protein
MSLVLSLSSKRSSIFLELWIVVSTLVFMRSYDSIFLDI